jgi:ectoine hydroxylase-related dioxygenase (phytanoyl-CoA dioxygenase family)
MSVTELDFEQSMLPWIDRSEADVGAFVDELRMQLQHWRDNGYVKFKRAAVPKMMARFLADWDRLYREHDQYKVLAVTSKGIAAVSQLSDEDMHKIGIRLIDFHNASPAARELALSPMIVTFLSLIFRNTVVAMQSLTFKYSSEQGPHQDFPFVVPRNAAHLAASWIALEDVSPDAGPLAYWPGSHRIRKFDFGNGLYMTPASPLREDSFQRHLYEEIDRLGLRREVFVAEKGDVFIWHSALIHEGTTMNNRALTRSSLVTHYTAAPYWPAQDHAVRLHASYPDDLRREIGPPIPQIHGAAFCWGDPVHPENNDIFV